MHVLERFAPAADGTRIWWRTAGEGAPAVLLTDGVGCAGFIWRELFPALAARRRVVHWNYRGHGRTERPRDLTRVTLDDCVDDLFTVMDAAGLDAAVLAGHSMGVQVSLEAHRRQPRRVRALVLACGAPGRTLDSFHGRRTLAQIFPYLRELVLARPDVARWAFRKMLPTEITLQLGRWLEVNRHLLRREDLEAYLADASEVDPEVFVRMLAAAAEHDATDHLPDVDVPTLVVAGDKDTWTPIAQSRAMVRAIPGSEMLLLPAGTHIGPLEHPELLQLRVEKFLAQRVDRARETPPRSPRA
jgi:pimeloyl-ACP methyl ester carboxylesterase